MKIPKIVQAALVRAVRSGAQAAILVIGTGAISLYDADWKTAIGAAGGMAIMSLLTSIAFPPPEGK